MTIDIEKIRKIKKPKVLILGNHNGIIQSILDFDFLSGKDSPSIVGIIGSSRRKVRYFWGSEEVLLKGYSDMGEANKAGILTGLDYFVIADSGRRSYSGVKQLLEYAPEVLGGMIFAESVPERHALAIRDLASQFDKFIFGPASVGFIIPGVVKLGAIAGTQPAQLVGSGALTGGSTAVISTSGGMINEIISFAVTSGHRLSFAAAIGGERYPIAKPVDIVSAVIKDKATKTIIFFGELGGRDEYEVADLVKKTGTKKKIIAYIAGTAAESMDSAPQFGHAKALAQSADETASAKRDYMRKANIEVAESFSEFELSIANSTNDDLVDSTRVLESRIASSISNIEQRKKKLFIDGVSTDNGGEVRILGEPMLQFIENKSLSEIALTMFLSKKPRSKKLVDFFDQTLRLLVDHGPQVSGVVNTMITARAGKDLSSSLAAGLLTIGDRFGGAISGAADVWLKAINSQNTPSQLVEQYSREKKYIPGIGHKKYRLDKPDPRVLLLLDKFGRDGEAVTFATEVALITSNKKAQLILNVDGVIAALLIDILKNEEGYTNEDIEALILSEFFNAIFIYARTIGMIAHYLDQRRSDEDLFRLPDDFIGDYRSF